MRSRLFLQTNLAARAKTAHRLLAINFVARVDAIDFAVAPEMLRNAELIALTLELLCTAFAERLAIALVRFVSVAAVEFAVANTGFSYAALVIASERMLSARNRRTQFDGLVAVVETVREAVAAPAQRDASAIVTFEFVRCTRTVRLVRSICAVIVTIANVLIVDAQILIRALEFGAGHASHVAIIFVTEVRTIIHAVATLCAGNAAAVGASELGFRAISHRAVCLVTFVHTIEMVIAIPSAGNALAAAASVKD